VETCEKGGELEMEHTINAARTDTD
jgi:hypothetical protein